MKERVVVITGASSGIGAQLAMQVAARGGRPVLVARREAPLREAAAKASSDAIAIVADVTRRSDVARVVQTAIDQAGRVDVWVNNAGRGITRMPSELTDEDFDEMMLVNVKSALYGAQAILPHFRARRDGHIINVSSLLGRVPLAVVRSAYTASKHALNGLMASLRVELAASDPGIHVSCVHPGVVATDFGHNARHGGMDSRALPGAQPVEEVAAVIADVIATPRADVYTRPAAQPMVVGYYAAEDMADVERAFVRPRR